MSDRLGEVRDRFADRLDRTRDRVADRVHDHARDRVSDRVDRFVGRFGDLPFGFVDRILATVFEWWGGLR